ERLRILLSVDSGGHRPGSKSSPRWASGTGSSRPKTYRCPAPPSVASDAFAGGRQEGLRVGPKPATSVNQSAPAVAPNEGRGRLFSRLSFLVVLLVVLVFSLWHFVHKDFRSMRIIKISKPRVLNPSLTDDMGDVQFRLEFEVETDTADPNNDRNT